MNASVDQWLPGDGFPGSVGSAQFSRFMLT